jgi:5'-nucleotidase
VLQRDGTTLFPATAVGRFGPIKIGFIGMTLKETGTLVTPSGVAGLHFADEAETANALVSKLRAQGVATIVLLIHQGGYLTPYYDRSCKGLNGAILPILDKLDPAISLVVSGHTHNAYICDIAEKGGGTRLLTSAGKYGTLLTDIRLRFSRRSHKLLGRSAKFHIVQGEGFTNQTGAFPLNNVASVDRADPRVTAIVRRYSEAARPIADRVVAHLPGPVSGQADANKEKPLGDLIADAQLAWARSHGGAQIAFMNGGGVRTDLTPRSDGSVTFGQIFALQPFGNGLVAQTLTGAQLKRLLEQQFLGPELMEPSSGFAFDYDETRPAGDRIVSATFEGKPIDPAASYRVVTNSFMASGGDNYTVLQEGTDRRDVGIDIDALEVYLTSGPAIPQGGRIQKLGAAHADK